jgi:hypothetical protein
LLLPAAVHAQAVEERVGAAAWAQMVEGPSAPDWTHATPLHKAARYGDRLQVLQHVLLSARL